MELARRNFLIKIMAGAAGIILSSPMISKSENSLIQNGNLFFDFQILQLFPIKPGKTSSKSVNAKHAFNFTTNGKNLCQS